MITIVDYQMGNLRSVQKGIERVGGEARISADAGEIRDAERLILPGVGAFGDAMAEINRAAWPIRFESLFSQDGRFWGSVSVCNCCSSVATNMASTKGWGFCKGTWCDSNCPPR